jgi:hypothetical protein
MSIEEPTDRDYVLMDRVLQEARDTLAKGGAGVAALLASPQPYRIEWIFRSAAVDDQW